MEKATSMNSTQLEELHKMTTAVETERISQIYNREKEAVAEKLIPVIDAAAKRLLARISDPNFSPKSRILGEHICGKSMTLSKSTVPGSGFSAHPYEIYVSCNTIVSRSTAYIKLAEHCNKMGFYLRVEPNDFVVEFWPNR